MRLLEQGPESQSASEVCSVGPSSRMDASDLDDHIFVPWRHKVIGIKAHCPFDGIYANVGMACHNRLMQALGTDEKHWLLCFRGGVGSESSLATTLVCLI